MDQGARGRIAATLLAAGVLALASGCGDDEDVSEQIEQDVQEQFEDAQDEAEQIQKDVEERLDEAQGQADEAQQESGGE